MELTCRSCSARFRAVIAEPLDKPVRLICPACKMEMILRPKVKAASSPPVAAPVPPRRNARLRAVVADEPRDFRRFLGEELEKLGFDTQFFEDGTSAMEAIRSGRPDLAIVNVYLKGTLGVEISEEIRRDPLLETTRVILIGALFRANRFRANPTNLYGADEYIEEQIPTKELRQILHRLMPDVAAGETTSSESADREEARRLARLILSDIVIYNAEKAESGVREGTFFELLGPEIAEGRGYFETRVRVSDRMAIFDEVLEQFVQMKRDEIQRVESS